MSKRTGTRTQGTTHTDRFGQVTAILYGGKLVEVFTSTDDNKIAVGEWDEDFGLQDFHGVGIWENMEVDEFETWRLLNDAVEGCLDRMMRER